MVQENKLEVVLKNTPLLKKKCSRCESYRFYCSEKFRINAQKKNIDIWLIYKCSNCDSTYNVTILTRKNPEVINKELYNKFLNNDIKTAWMYAFSPDFANKNSIEFDFASVEYYLKYHGDSLDNLINYQKRHVIFEIVYPFNYNLKISTIIKELLGISSNQVVQLIDREAILVDSKLLQKKDKVRNGMVVKIDVDRL